MFKKSGLVVLAIFLFFGVLFFNKTFFQGQIPFPGDLLIGDYSPYRFYSYLGYEPGSYPHKAQNIDVIEQLYPWKHFSIESLKGGEFPLWNPHNFSGTPHLAAIQSGTLYPFNVLFLFMPLVLAWSIYIIVQPILAGIFTYFFLKESKLNFKASVFGGLVFSFSSFLVVWMQYGNMVHALIWLPLILFLILKNIKKPTLVKSIIISLLLSFSIFAGHFQISMYLYVFSFAFAIFVIWCFYKNQFISNFLRLVAIYFFSLLLAAAQLLPSIEIFLNSSRSPYAFSELIKFLVPSYHTISIFFPDFFGNPVSRNYMVEGTYIERVTYFGIVPLFFAIYAFVSKRTPYIWFFLISIIIVYLIAFDTFITRFLYSIFTPPVIASSVPTRILFILTFSGSVLAAFGYFYIEKSKDIKKYLISLIIMIALILLSFGGVLLWNPSWFENISISIRNMVVPSGVLFLAIIASFIYLKRDYKLIKKYSAVIKKSFFIFILIITIIELYFFFDKFSPFAPPETVYPKTSVMEFLRENQEYSRSWGYGSAKIPANIQTYEQTYSASGYDPFYIKRYGELMASTKNGNIPDDIKRANARLADGYGNENLRNNIYRQKAMNLLGVKYLVHNKPQDNHAHDNTFDRNIYDLVWNDNNLQVYENNRVLPRAFLATDYVVLENDEDIIDTIYSEDFDLTKTIIVEKNPEIDISESNEYNLEISEYSGNEVVVNVNTENESLMFLSDAYFPGWKAYLDGEESEIYRANYAFRAVKVPEGEHRVMFRYEPLMSKIGVIISSISAAFVLIFVSGFVIKKMRR